jgi:DtxR family Mn-dependent transcriptional regulator
VSRAHSLDEYLETIYFLAFPAGEYGPVVKDSPALSARIAEMLGVSRPTAGEMLKRLESEGLIERGEHKEALLTDKGRHEAERVVRRHRLIERLLTDFMGYTPAESHERADMLGDAFTDEMIERVAERLGHPERCPHGWPIDPAVEQAENRELVALSDLRSGDRARIVRLAEHDGELLKWFYEHGLTPDANVERGAHQVAARQLTVRIDDGERTLSDRAAASILVRRA